MAIVNAACSLIGAGTLDVSGGKIITSMVRLTGVGTFSASAYRTRFASASGSGHGVLTVNAGMLKPSSVSFLGGSLLSAAILRKKYASASFVGDSSLMGEVFRFRGAIVDFTGDGLMTVKAFSLFEQLANKPSVKRIYTLEMNVLVKGLPLVVAPPTPEPPPPPPTIANLYWVSTAAPDYASIDEDGFIFTATAYAWGCPAYVDIPKSTGKSFYAVELISFATVAFVYAIGVSKAYPPVTFARTSFGQPSTNEYCYGKYLGSKKWIDGVPSAYGTLCVAGDIVGIGYDADTGEVHGFRLVAGDWVDDGVLTTLAPGTQCFPFAEAVAGSSTQVSLGLRNDIDPPVGYDAWGLVT